MENEKPYSRKPRIGYRKSLVSGRGCKFRYFPGPISGCRWVRQARVRKQRWEGTVANRALLACGAELDSTVMTKAGIICPLSCWNVVAALTDFLE